MRRPVDDEQLQDVIGLVVAQLRAGAHPASAWAVALEFLPGHPAAGWRDPLGWLDAVGLDRAAARSVRSAAVSVAAGWRLADRTGAPLADVLGDVAAGLRRESRIASDIEAALAGPRATVRLLGVLPIAGIGLGQLIGAHPLVVLLGSAAGRVCLGLGLTLLLVGRLWMGRLVSRAGAAG